MQMLVNYKIADYAKFKSAFDADNEDRRNNGLALLQLWREDSGSAWALFDLHDAKKAQDYLDGAAGVFNSQAGVSATSAHILETA
ncbi:hypothetical protein [Paracoccus sp. SCSIO 75233]|uniref:hypothetical protein n=1 Tax=Paracoccus sp. SCSIO 75233 TaxID=3017782 RepID=UPI0022F0F1A4|nr:hypothetical protein [Paracoccus sp. SCSIO 75233]WBU52295.1 hypothetical protein PAF12_10670 [Paracoccus sp. SCSIO 75233]